MGTPILGLEQGRPASSRRSALYQRALAIWPRLDPAALRRCHQDPRRVAALVSRRTSLPLESIMVLLTMPRVSAAEADTWFG